ncbi:MAG: carboxymuconolactone decarboxylase family protein [bacterium]|jgi:AhpD family alkylhydroperoxidase
MAEGKTGLERFKQERARLQEQFQRFAGTNSKRFLALDNRVYEAGALSAKTKELLGLVASLVLRCDDCISYHLDRCRSEGVTTAELEEAIAIGLIVGGSITIPHIRRAVDAWLESGGGESVSGVDPIE